MLFLKITGSGIIMISALSLVAAMSKYERRSVTVLEEFSRLINYAKNQIDLYCAPSESIIDAASKGDEFGLDLYGAHSFADVIRKNWDYLTPDAKRELSTFASELGGTYRSEQVKRCDYYLEVLDGIKKRAQDALAGKIKLQRTLILSLAVGIILVLW